MVSTDGQSLEMVNWSDFEGRTARENNNKTSGKKDLGQWASEIMTSISEEKWQSECEARTEDILTVPAVLGKDLLQIVIVIENLFVILPPLAL